MGSGPAGRGVVGPALIFVSGIGLVLAAVFPLREDAAGVTYDPGGHFVAGVVFFLSSAVGTGRLSGGWPRPALAEHRRPTRSAPGWSALAGFFLLGALAMPDDAPLHEWAGLAQRVVILAVLFPARIVLSVRLLRIEQGRSWPGRPGEQTMPPDEQPAGA